MSALTCERMTCERTTLAVPCHVEDPDLWFAEDPRDLEQAKVLCGICPIRRECLDAALERQEPWGVWGGEILARGTVVARKRPRGRPRKSAQDPGVTEGTEGTECGKHADGTDGSKGTVAA